MPGNTTGKKGAGSGLVLAFGTFDLLHPGHLHYFREARKLGSRLYVVVATDKNVFRVKKRRPVYAQGDRAALVGALEMVDKALVGDEKDIYKIVKRLKPAVVALGYDQKPSNARLKKEFDARGINSKIVRLKAFNPRKHKSSKLRKKICTAFA